MRRGTTTRFVFTIDTLEEISVSDVFFTIEQDFGSYQVEATERAVAIADNKYAATFSQEKTMQFQKDKDAQYQIKLKTTDGKVIASNIIREKVKNILNEEIL